LTRRPATEKVERILLRICFKHIISPLSFSEIYI